MRIAETPAKRLYGAAALAFALSLSACAGSRQTAGGGGSDAPDVVAAWDDVRLTLPEFERAYVTACCALLTDSGRRLVYSLAGHPPPLLRRADGRLERLELGSLPLTLDPGAAYPSGAVSLAPGDRLLVFTDGLVDAPNAKEELFGAARLRQVLEANAALTADALAERLVEELRLWIGPDAPLHDDVTLVVVDVAGA